MFYDKNKLGYGKIILRRIDMRYLKGKIKDDDIFVMLDSDDKFTSSQAVSKCVKQVENTGANVCIAGFDLSGDMDLVLKRLKK